MTRTYLALDSNRCIEIDWDNPTTAARAQAHLGCSATVTGRTVGRIAYCPATFCDGPDQLPGIDKGSLRIRTLPSGELPADHPIFKDHPSMPPERVCEAIFFETYMVLFAIRSDQVRVYYHPTADVETLVDDIFQMAVREVVRPFNGWLFHSAAVSIAGTGVLLVGSSGSGKSTTCLTLLTGDGEFFGDDASLVITDDAAPLLVPMAHELSVRVRSLALFPFVHDIKLHPVADRFFWRQARTGTAPVPLGAVCRLSVHTGTDTRITQMGPEAFIAAYENKPPLHGLDRNGFDHCVHELHANGVRFLHVQVGTSPEATRRAFAETASHSCPSHTADGTSRIVSIGEGQGSVSQAWADPAAASPESLIPLLGHPHEGLARSAEQALSGHPLAQLEPLPWSEYDEIWPVDTTPSKWVDWCRMPPWRDGAATLMAHANDHFVENNIDRWLNAAPALFPLIRDATKATDPVRAIVDAAWQRYLFAKYPPQLMLYLTDRCPLRCVYCFAADNVFSKRRDLPMADAQRILKWAADQALVQISLTGGEPTAYPHFRELMDTIARYGFGVYFSTNLLFDKSLRPWVARVTSLEVHLCDPGDYSDTQRCLLDENLAWLRDQPMPKKIRYNLYRSAPEDWRWVVQRVATFPKAEFGYAVPFPSANRQNLFVARDQLAAFADTVTQFVGESRGSGVRPLAAKPYPLCAFDAETAMDLIGSSALRGTCELGASDGTRNLLIDPEGRFFPCIAVTASPGNRSDFDSLEEIQRANHSMLKDFFNRPPDPLCDGCELRAWKLCIGGCFSYCQEPAATNG